MVSCSHRSRFAYRRKNARARRAARRNRSLRTKFTSAASGRLARYRIATSGEVTSPTTHGLREVGQQYQRRSRNHRSHGRIRGAIDRAQREPLCQRERGSRGSSGPRARPVPPRGATNPRAR